MKTTKKITLILAIITLALVGVAGYSFAGVVDDTKFIVAGADRYEDSDPTGSVIDNFNDAGNANLWGGATGPWEAGGATCGSSNDSTSPQEGSFCLKLDYNVSTGDSFAGYYSQLVGHDVTPYTALSFWVKGASGGEFFKIEIKNNEIDANRNHAAVYIADFLDGGVTTSWQKVEIPFRNFANIGNWSDMKEFVITFENSAFVINGSPTQGTVYIDKVEVENVPVNVVRVDRFGDKLSVCSLGGQMGDMPNPYPTAPWARHSFSSVEYEGYPYSMFSEYDITAGSKWSGQWIIFGGGDSGETEIPQNFSDYTYISFYIKAKSTGENPGAMKIALTDNTSEKYAIIEGITTGWSFYRINLDDFTTDHNNPSATKLEKDSIRQLSFLHVDWVTKYLGTETYVGAVYVDKVQFEK